MLAAFVPSNPISFWTLLLLLVTDRLLLLLLIVLILLDVLLFGGAGHLAHAHVIFGLLVHRLHIVPRCQHLMLAQLARALGRHPLLALPFALFGSTALIQSRV